MSGHEPGDVDPRALVVELLTTELRSLSLQVADGIAEHALKSLDERGTAQELIRQQYTGRYPFELLQNANDAAASAAGNRSVLFELTKSALVVADGGYGFGTAEVKAICSLGRSSKDPRKSIGYKGLGFKAVGEITDRPQIYSPPHAFGFDGERVHHEVTEVLAKELPPGQHLPVYAFPFSMTTEDAGEDADLVESLLDAGYATVVRLPLKPNVARQTVRTHLADLLSPELLLFLDSTDALKVRGARRDFAARSRRENRGDHDVVTIERDAMAETWLVFRRQVRIPDRSLVAGLGEPWQQVTEVTAAAALRLDETGRPVASGLARPMHVYFPLADSAGLPVVLHADFFLDLDRHHVSRAPEASAYNDWLAQQLTTLVAETVAPRVAELFPSYGGVVAAFAPVESAQGFGVRIRELYRVKMAKSAFVPCLDGETRAPTDVTVLPADVPRARRVVEYCDLADLGHLTMLDTGFTKAADDWLRVELRARALVPEDLFRRMRDPGKDSGAFYSWLVEWADAARPRVAFVRSLKGFACVRTSAGGWLSPTSRVFFPRQGAAVALPAEIPVDIADLPEIEGLHELMTEAGVRPFRWRELLVETVLPLLSSAETGQELRGRARAALRAYYLQSEDRGDQEILARVGDVLVMTKTAGGDLTTWSKARATYFGRDWTGNDDLELIYGLFGDYEFLAEQIPETDDARHKDHRYFEWLGVSPRPRLDRVEAVTGDRYKLPADRHPHRALDTWWSDWTGSRAFLDAWECGEGHPASQQLTVSVALDRLPDLIANADPARLGLLAKRLAREWSHYESGLNARLTCVHQSHRGERTRETPSLFGYLLSASEWLPCQRSSHAVMRRPRAAWRDAPDLPRSVRSWLPLLDPTLDVQRLRNAWNDLDVVDSARPGPPALIALLRELAAASEALPEDTNRNQLADVARWAMHQLNESMSRGDALDKLPDEGVPLLAKLGGRHIFTPDPYVAQDATLIDTWADICPILDADRGLSVLTQRFGLRDLSKDVCVEPQPYGIRLDRVHEIEARLSDVLVHLAAVAVQTAPSRRERILIKLRNLVVMPCDRLLLGYSLRGITRQRASNTFIQRSRDEDAVGPRRSVGTIYVQIDQETGWPDWYSVGPLLADHLQVPSQRDAFALLLTGDECVRLGYLRSRNVTDADLAATREAMALADDPDEPSPTVSEAGPAAAATTEDSLNDSRGAAEATPDLALAVGEPVPASSGRPSAQSRTDRRPPPPLDMSVFAMEEAAEDITVTWTQRAVTPTALGGSTESVDWVMAAENAREHGRRGEEWAYAQEQHRLEQVGLDPGRVVWISRLDEFANHDLASVDNDGHPIFIEVKANDSSEPATPVELSSGELDMAFKYRERYFIYHVLDVNSSTPRVIRYRDPVGRVQGRLAQLRVAGARLLLAPRRSAAAE